MTNDKIIIRGAKVNNLQNIDVDIPRDKLVVLTGLSGSGKSSLAFDTIYAEGQRRYIESLSSYARQFLGQMEKPDVESIEGLSPAISIDQKTTSKNPRSTVGTVTEIYDYYRLLYARIGIPHCPVCGREISRQTVDQIVGRLQKLEEGTKFIILSPVVRGRKGEHQKVFEDARKRGYSRVRVDGINYDLDEEIRLEKNVKHNIEIVVDRLVMKEGVASRLADSIETATAESGGLVYVDVNGEIAKFSQNFACEEHGINIDELAPRSFSFNAPYGACSRCSGLGSLLEIDPDLVVPDRSRSIRRGAITVSGWRNYEGGTMAEMYLEGIAAHYGFSLETPFCELPEKIQNIVLFGSGDEKIKFTKTRGYGAGSFTGAWEGVVPNLARRYRETSSSYSRADIERYMSAKPCPECGGDRLNKTILSVTVGGLNIKQLTDLTVADELKFFERLELTERQRMIAEGILKEIDTRLKFLVDVGLPYLSLARASATLSGGESQRIRLATQIGSALMGVLYVLDEPSIGLHQRDNQKLLNTLCRLRDVGNTLIVVEHDEETMLAADYIVDIGPGAGVHGGRVVAAGTPQEVMRAGDSITGQYLSGRKKIDYPKKRRKGNGKKLKILGAAENNLQNVNVEIPLGTFTAVTGVSGSGKSSLINEVLYKKLACKLNGARIASGSCREIKGIEYLDKVIDIDQSPIGRTPRSNPATYTGVFTDIRALYAETPDAKMRGYGQGRFSFNVKGGRCEACQGDGILKIEMHFLSDIYVPCEVCKGKRYNRETLEVQFKGKNINDVLEMTVEEGLAFFENQPRIRNKLQTLYDVGLSYIKIGQPSTTLSGGEAQRVKLATELARRSTGKTVYILDEPTTGLHSDDVAKLISVLQKFVDDGNTVIVIEHNLDVIKNADYVIDLGPEGGDMGGRVVACGTPEQVAKVKQSATGEFLARVLTKG